MTYISLFAGIGGFDLALNRQGHTCVYANEWDKYAAQIYEKNFGHKPDTRDIATVGSQEIPEADLLVGGFPCQSFSVAGSRRGFTDIRGTMFFQIARIAEEKRPRFLLLENVKGLLSHDQGQTFRVILNTLAEIGYDCQWQVLNSKAFGVAQNRERVFIVGHLRGEPRPPIFPIQGTNSEVTEQNKSTAIDVNYFKGIDNHGQRTMIMAVQTLGRATKRQNGRRIKMPGEIMFTLTNQDNHGVYDGNRIRKLTPIECERLQGFPDDWTKFGDLYLDKELMKMRNTVISDSQRYKCLGNAVTVNVVEEIVKRFI